MNEAHWSRIAIVVRERCASGVSASYRACTLAAQADLIVSGDADLLVLKQSQGIRIVTATQAVESIAGTLR